MNAFQLACKACGKLIPAEDVNIEKAIAKCQACDAVFGFMDSVAQAGPDLPKPLVPTPKSIRVDSWGPELTLTRRWYSHGLWALLLFCIFWDGFLVVWYTIGVRELLGGKGELGGPGIWPIVFMLAFPVLHVAVGLAMTYIVITGFVNRTVVRIAGGELSVWHGPLPWPSHQRIFTSDIKQLYCAEVIRRNSDSCSKTYNVLAVTGKSDLVTLVSGLEDLDQGRFIEQQVEQHLKIRDERVPGEVRV